MTTSSHTPPSTETIQIVDRNLKWYTRYQTFREPLFWGPILILAHAKLAHMDLSQIYYSEILAIIIIMLLNVRMGIWADKIGHLKVMRVGEAILFVSFLCFASMSAPWHAWLANCLWAVGYSCIDSADNAYLQENLKVADREKEHNHQNVYTVRFRFLLTSFTGLVTGFLAEVHMRLPMIISIFPLAYSMYSIWKMKEAPCLVTIARRQALQAQKDKEVSKRMSKEIFKEAVHTIKSNPLVLWGMAFFVTMMLVNKIWFFTYNNYFDFVGLPVWMYGVIFMLLNVTGYFAIIFRKKIIPEGTEMRRGLLIAVFAAICPLIQGLFPMMIFAFLPALQIFSRTFAKSISSHLIQGSSLDTSRATTQSIVSTIKDLFTILALMLFGAISHMWKIDRVLIVLGIVVSICVIVLFSIYHKSAKFYDVKKVGDNDADAEAIDAGSAHTGKDAQIAVEAT